MTVPVSIVVRSSVILHFLSVIWKQDVVSKQASLQVKQVVQASLQVKQVAQASSQVAQTSLQDKQPFPFGYFLLSNERNEYFFRISGCFLA